MLGDIEGFALVSIHAPAGGATKSRLMHLWLHGGFNPRARGGRDSIANIY